MALALSDSRRFAQEQQRWFDEQRTRMQQDRLILWQSIVAVHKQRYGPGDKNGVATAMRPTTGCNRPGDRAYHTGRASRGGGQA